MTEHRIELVAAGEYRRQHYGVTHASAYVHQVRGCSSPVRVEVWDNTGRPNPHPGETKWNKFGPIGGNGKYLDPRNAGTDEAVTVLLSPEATVVSAHGDSTGTEASGQVWAAETTPIATGDTLVLVYPDGAVTVWTVEVDHSGHGHAEPDDSDRARNLAARFSPQREDDAASLPCVEIAGVQVCVYFEGGELHISVDYAGADASVLVDDDRVPTRFLMNGMTTLQG